MVTVVRDPEQVMRADPSRVIARLFLPAADLPGGTRAESVLASVLALDDQAVDQAVGALLRDFSGRHHDLLSTLRRHARIGGSRVADMPALSAAREALLGAIFTAEGSVEGAALCNPSVVQHPDQGGVAVGQARVLVSLRAIGEGHISAIEFGSALVGPGPRWVFEPREHPLATGAVRAAPVRRRHLRAMLEDVDRHDLLARAVLAVLPPECTSHDLEAALEDMPTDLLIHPEAGRTTAVLRELVASSYEVSFPEGVGIGQQVLLPANDQESHGVEDARFVRFQRDDGTVEYRGTYTAYDGTRIAPRLLTSADLRTFRSSRLTGPAARNKGMALFPRTIGGRHHALCRVDGYRNSIATSTDGVHWGRPATLEDPPAIWRIMQVGNCGSPLETPEGWLVLTHGVGPMRRYSIGATLLDLEDPTRVVARLDEALVTPTDAEQEGYVPNVVFSCGGIIHDGVLWLPYGIGDARIGVASVDMGELLGAMRREGSSTVGERPAQASSTGRD